MPSPSASIGEEAVPPVALAAAADQESRALALCSRVMPGSCAWESGPPVAAGV